MGDVGVPNAQKILSELADWSRLAGEGVSIASFAGFNDEGQFLVVVGEGLEPVKALSTIGLTDRHTGSKVVLAFDRGDVRRPIIIGCLHERKEPAVGAVCKMDGERLLLHAEREIELRCGEASIVLTRAGKILIRGNYVLTRSRGANKIKGAFVDIN